MIRVFQVKCENEEDIGAALRKKLNIKRKQDLVSYSVRKRSTDARAHKVLFSYTVDAEVKNEEKYLKMKDVHKAPDETYRFAPEGGISLSSRPVVAGFGPCGMFAALLLAQYGYKPLILERGPKIDQRSADAKKFWQTGKLNCNSNVQFGEGGAGAFSDGKLTTRSKDPRGRKVLEELHAHGAKKNILVEQHPHIGTDAFVTIIKALRKDIESMGGEFMFETKLEKINVIDGKLESIEVTGHKTIDCQALIVASGHSADDTVKMLYENGVDMKAKPFAIGVRIEHLQDYINEAMLGPEYAKDPRLIPARYQLTDKTSSGKGVYTFCMCPGGVVIPASSDDETLVVNGMSYSSRAGRNANSALLVQVDSSDYGDGLFDGLDYQKKIEKKAYELTGSYKAPAQLASDFIEGKVSSKFKEVLPSYALKTEFKDLNELFDAPVAEALKEALVDFERKVPGFVTNGAILLAPETRSSSSISMIRDTKSRMSTIEGVYPAGEGSGHAGGIMTSAIDGLTAAEALMDRYKAFGK